MSASPYTAHLAAARAERAGCAVITLSDTRTLADDFSGDAVVLALRSTGHEVVTRDLLPDDAGPLEVLLHERLASPQIDVILTTGGTGVSPRDQAADVVARLVERPLPGFGEIFRLLSFQEIGSGAILSRAIAGTVQRKLIFALPGSTPAVDLAMNKLILPELPHLLRELRK